MSSGNRAILAAHDAAKIYQTSINIACQTHVWQEASSLGLVEGPRRLPLLRLIAAAALGSGLPNVIDVLHEMLLHAVHYFRELEPQPHFQQVVVLGDSCVGPFAH